MSCYTLSRIFFRTENTKYKPPKTITVISAHTKAAVFSNSRFDFLIYKDSTSFHISKTLYQFYHILFIDVVCYDQYVGIFLLIVFYMYAI